MIVVAQSGPFSAALAVSLTPTEKDAVKVTAKASGLSMSAWARQAITAALSTRP